MWCAAGSSGPSSPGYRRGPSTWKERWTAHPWLARRQFAAADRRMQAARRATALAVEKAALDNNRAIVSNSLHRGLSFSLRFRLYLSLELARSEERRVGKESRSRW